MTKYRVKIECLYEEIESKSKYDAACEAVKRLLGLSPCVLVQFCTIKEVS